MPTAYDGVTISVQISSARPGEAQFRETTVDAANEQIRNLLQEALRRKYPGATVSVETGGDRPSAEVTGTDDLRIQQIMKYDAERTGLAIKWDFSQQGLGLKPSYT